MQRIPEPELMNDRDQAVAYANADFEEPHNRFITEFKSRFPAENVSGHVLDLGCGPADIAIRFARAFPGCHIDGIDGAQAMLREGEKAVADADLAARIRLQETLLPAPALPRPEYDVIISNSLLHHLHEPLVLWQTINNASRPGTIIFIMDLMRPDSEDMARDLVHSYAAAEPAVLQRDFYHSLCAAFTPAEVGEQLHAAGLDALELAVISDRHLVVHGRYAQ